jgi:hypothetical protein
LYSPLLTLLWCSGQQKPGEHKVRPYGIKPMIVVQPETAALKGEEHELRKISTDQLWACASPYSNGNEAWVLRLASA